MSWAHKIVIPFLPPSTNNMYGFDKRSGKRYLKKEGRKFQEKVKSITAQHMAKLNQLPDGPSTVLVVRFNVFFGVLNKSWGEGAKTRYKRWDVSNRIKAVEDAIRGALLDDSHNFMITMAKFHEPDESKHRVEIYIEESNPALFGIPEDC